MRLAIPSKSCKKTLGPFEDQYRELLDHVLTQRREYRSAKEHYQRHTQRRLPSLASLARLARMHYRHHFSYNKDHGRHPEPGGVFPRIMACLLQRCPELHIPNDAQDCRVERFREAVTQRLHADLCRITEYACLRGAIETECTDIEDYNQHPDIEGVCATESVILAMADSYLWHTHLSQKKP